MQYFDFLFFNLNGISQETECDNVALFTSQILKGYTNI